MELFCAIIIINMSEFLLPNYKNYKNTVLQLKYSEGYNNGPFMVKSVKTLLFSSFFQSDCSYYRIATKGFHLLIEIYQVFHKIDESIF